MAVASSRPPPAGRSRLFVTGASGLLGANFVAAAAERHEVLAGHHQHPWSWPGAQSLALDLRDEAAVRGALDRFQPAIIAHFAALTSVDRCESHPDEARAFNVQPAAFLAQWARERGALILFMSTDSVFDGQRGGYREADTPAPLNRYAASKLAAEEEIRRAGAEHLIVRANIFGWNSQAKSSLAEWALAQLEQGRAMPGFTDVIFAPLLVNTLADLMLDLLARRARGTWHAASRQPVSKYDFARAVAAAFDLPASLVQPARLAEARLSAPRPLNTALDASGLREKFGIDGPELAADLSRFRRLREEGFVSRLKSASLPSP